MFQKLIKHRAISIVFAASLLLVAGGWLWAYVALRGISQPLIIHFTHSGGINQVGDIRDLSNVGLLGAVIVLVNFGIAVALEERDRFLAKFVAAGTLFVAILIFIGFAAIIGVN